jgi:hypothetical protein
MHFSTHDHEEFMFVLRAEVETLINTNEGVMREQFATGDCLLWSLEPAALSLLATPRASGDDQRDVIAPDIDLLLLLARKAAGRSSISSRPPSRRGVFPSARLRDQ